MIKDMSPSLSLFARNAQTEKIVTLAKRDEENQFVFFSPFSFKDNEKLQHFIPRQPWPPGLSPRTHRAHLQKKKSTPNTRTQIRLGTLFSDELVRDTTETGHYHIRRRTTETRVWEIDPVPTKCNGSYTRNSSSKTQDRRHLIVQNEIFSVQDKGRGVETYTGSRWHIPTHGHTRAHTNRRANAYRHKRALLQTHRIHGREKRGWTRASFQSGPLGRRMMESTHFLVQKREKKILAWYKNKILWPDLFPTGYVSRKCTQIQGPSQLFEINDSSLWKSSQWDSVCQCVHVKETYSQISIW